MRGQNNQTNRNFCGSCRPKVIVSDMPSSGTFHSPQNRWWYCTVFAQTKSVNDYCTCNPVAVFSPKRPVARHSTMTLSAGAVIRRNVPRLDRTSDGDNNEKKPLGPRRNNPPPPPPRRRTQAFNPFRQSGPAKPSCSFQGSRFILPTFAGLVFSRIFLHLVSQQESLSLPTLYPIFASLHTSHDKSTSFNFRPGRWYPSSIQLHGKMSSVDPLSEKDYSWLVGDEWDDEECVPMHKWMLPSYSPYTCNSLHELDLEPYIKFINSGGSRSAFEIRDHNGNPLVLKQAK